MTSRQHPSNSIRSLPHRPDHLSTVFVQSAQVIARVIEGQSLSGLLDETKTQLHQNESAAVSHLCYNVLRNFGSLEAIVDALAKRPPTQSTLIALLTTACYRLRDKPALAYATIDQAVEAAKRLKLPTGFVNGLLRNYLRQRHDIDAFIETSTDPEIRWNFPAWWLYLLQQTYPDQWQTIVTASNSHPPMGLRVNRRKVDPDDYLNRLRACGIDANRIGKVGVLLDQPMAVSELPGFFEGCVSVQDIGAQRAAELLDSQGGDHVLDACCAPGGKTGHLLESADISIVGLDIGPERLSKVRDNLDRLGLYNEDRVSLTACDCLDTDGWFDGRPFDRILLDVPCSASGVVRRHPDGKWLKQPGDIEALGRLQQAMLARLWPLLKPGGCLLYVTCSLFPAENADQIEKFLSVTPDALSIALDVRAEGLAFLQLLPDQNHDGFFYAKLQKSASG